jgi:alkanesulfonate monooxygenase SsuD/methylene tetrahydromethanopterin reductase-like flavin-dependent oxidoreductase (luciferase family)
VIGLDLSILDQSPVSATGSPCAAIQESVKLAAALDGLGFIRYWFAEHHHSRGFAGTAPEVMVAAALERTRQLRIGSGGVLLPRYSAAKVREVFTVLAALHPGRVDLGLGRAGGDSTEYPEQVALLRARQPAGTGPADDHQPELWLLGAGTGSAGVAAAQSINFAYGHFLNPTSAGEALLHHQQHARPVPGGPRAARIIAVRAIAADSEARATELAASFLLWRSRKDLGADLPFPTAEQARSHSWTLAESRRRQANLSNVLFGSAEQVRAQLLDLTRALPVAEIMINTPLADPQARLESYLALAEVFGLRAGLATVPGPMSPTVHGTTVPAASSLR